MTPNEENNSNRAVCCRGLRGATTVEENTSAAILRATRELLALLIRYNNLNTEDIASAIFTTTPDLTAEFPALAARQLNWMNVALMCGHEMHVSGALPMCIRVLIHWNTDKKPDEIQHVFINGAAHLRPDKADLPPVDWDELQRWIEEHSNPDIKSNRK
ncbi:MAG: chorismate mutase [Thermoguttaceae bacterium]|nr:chorismate mutase [Thermoguttaceae bacterium]